MRYSRRLSATFATALVVLIAGCARGNKAEMEDAYRPDPIPVHVRNENFLDMNVSFISGGVTRRLGTVSGNGSSDFKIAWSAAGGQPIVMTATPIGGRGGVNSAALQVGSGQMIDFKIGSVLRQSVAVVREP